MQNKYLNSKFIEIEFVILKKKKSNKQFRTTRDKPTQHNQTITKFVFFWKKKRFLILNYIYSILILSFNVLHSLTFSSNSILFHTNKKLEQHFKVNKCRIAAHLLGRGVCGAGQQLPLAHCLSSRLLPHTRSRDLSRALRRLRSPSSTNRRVALAALALARLLPRR